MSGAQREWMHNDIHWLVEWNEVDESVRYWADNGLGRRRHDSRDVVL